MGLARRSNVRPSPIFRSSSQGGLQPRFQIPDVRFSGAERPNQKARDTIVSDEQVLCRPAEALIVRPPWHQGRVAGERAGIALEDSIVLAEQLGSGDPLSDVLTQFNERRYERCHMIVENSVQLGEWEKEPKSQRADYVKLMDESMRALAQPI
jgi:hypothetical protein